MPRLNFSYDIQDTLNKAVTSAKTQAEIENNIQKWITKSADKIYAARFLDLELKKIGKALKNLELSVKERQQEAEKRSASGDPLLQLQNGIASVHQQQGNYLNYLANQLQPGLRIYRSSEELYAEKVKKMKEQLDDTFLRLNIARAAIKLNSTEKMALYPTLFSIYQEQVAKRKWYQRGSVALFFSIILFPLSPIIYYLWKNERSKEMIQANPQTMSERNLIREHRKAFKEAANGEKLHFFTKKDDAEQHDEIPEYVTKYKLERDQFYLKARFFASKSDISFIKNSKDNDNEFKLSMGMR
ncbi:MAG: hypothetical protein P4L79_16630 [Legionella sp.]|uniref:hypothetical protein n=1 Tax=Legionella sp. TaxID=459 RepID=UPI00284669B5|nr:hypothetical protein [Legionella sp.]